MSVTVNIDEPQLLPSLLDLLEAGGCSARRVGSSACRVEYDEAESADEALHELRFFIRAWARSNGDVTVRLQPEL
jgi:hypothetical protein